MQKLPLALAFGVLLAIGAPLASAATETVVKVDLNDDAIRFDQPSIHAGRIKFVVTNVSIYDSHEMVLVKAGDAAHPIVLDPKKRPRRRSEAAVARRSVRSEARGHGRAPGDARARHLHAHVQHERPLSARHACRPQSDVAGSSGNTSLSRPDAPGLSAS